MEALKRNLKAHVDIRQSMIPPDFKHTYTCFEDMVLKIGIECNPKEFDISRFPMARRTPKECFNNAFELAMIYSDLIYVEGYCMDERIPLPIHHAWVMDNMGNVIDPTLRDSETFYYFGIPFNFSFVKKTVYEKETYGVFDDWSNQFPLLKKGIPETAIYSIS